MDFSHFFVLHSAVVNNKLTKIKKDYHIWIWFIYEQSKTYQREAATGGYI